MSAKLIQSYLKEQYFVSTIYRQSSAVYLPIWYYETIVWRWDKKTTRHRGELLTIHDSGTEETYAIDNHALICVKLLEEGD